MSSFKDEVRSRIEANGGNHEFQAATDHWMAASISAQYSYNFSWLGRPIIQYPQDIVALQELIWTIQPDLIIETGIAHGGSLILSASMLAQLDMADAIKEGGLMDPSVSARKVLGIDVDIRAHNRAAIEGHPLASRIEMIQGSSIAPNVVEEVRQVASGFERVLVCLDSNHTHAHVLAELEAYAPFVSPGSYCVVFDTLIEDLAPDHFPDRPWGPGNNPKTAVREYLKTHPEFTVDEPFEHKIMITAAPSGYLRRVC